MRAAFGRASPEHRDLTPIDCCRNIGRTLDDFQCSVQIINRLLPAWLQSGWSGAMFDEYAGDWPNKKAGARPAFRYEICEFRLGQDQYFAITGPPQR
jgi:hypothetical protein